MKTQICRWIFVVTLALTGCDESVGCPDIYHPRVSGTVIDERGENILPDRVMLLGKDANECEIYPQGLLVEDNEKPSFACYSSGDQLVIYYGAEVMEVDVPKGDDPCGLDYPVLEITWNPE